MARLSGRAAADQLVALDRRASRPSSPGPAPTRPSKPNPDGPLRRPGAVDRVPAAGRARPPPPSTAASAPWSTASSRPTRCSPFPRRRSRAAGLSGAKTASIRDLAAKVGDGTVPLAPLSRLDDEAIIRAARDRPRHRPLDGGDVPDLRARPAGRVARRRPRRPRAAGGWSRASRRRRRPRRCARSASATDPSARWRPGTAGRPSTRPAARTRRDSQLGAGAGPGGYGCPLDERLEEIAHRFGGRSPRECACFRSTATARRRRRPPPAAWWPAPATAPPARRPGGPAAARRRRPSPRR